jgi:hypothetical protein
VKYLVRANPKAYNPITRKVDLSRFWEVEQCADRDSEKVIWHCAAVRVGNEVIHDIPPDSVLEFYGVVVRGADDAIVILEGKHDVES